MNPAMNALPVQTYARQRVQTIVEDISSDSAGSISLDLAKPSDVTLIIVSDYFGAQPSFFIAAVGRAPSMSDFDVIISPIDEHYVKDQSRVTLCLPAGSTTLQWKGLAADGDPEPFPAANSLLVLAIDQ